MIKLTEFKSNLVLDRREQEWQGSTTNPPGPGSGSGSSINVFSGSFINYSSGFPYYNYNHQGHSAVAYEPNNNTESSSTKLREQNSHTVYIPCCSGIAIPFRVIVILAGLVQIVLGIFAIYFFSEKNQLYKYFPQYGHVGLASDPQDSIGIASYIWFGIEITQGLWLICNVVFKAPRLVFTLWIWTILSLLMASLVDFCWVIPFAYEAHGAELCGKFSLQLLFHLLLVGVGREYYKQIYSITWLNISLQ